MKLRLIIVLLITTLFFISCEQDDTAGPANPSSFILGDWTVSSFVKGNVDMTNEFGEFTFHCTKNGGMSIQGNGRNYNCSWENINENDSIFNFQIMGCGQNSPLYECIDDWHLTSYDSLHCCFTSHNPNHHRNMTWERKN